MGNQFEIVRGFFCPTNRHGEWQHSGIHPESTSTGLSDL